MNRPDPAWLDAQYNARAAIPEHGRIFARWAADSAAQRARLKGRIDLRYGDGPKETLDAFAARRSGAPILFFIHGGYWRALDKSDQSFLAPAFVDAGAAVVLPNYALCPAVGIATIALQVARALAWTWRHAAEFGGDAGRIVVAGHSAGGHLAAMMLACRWPQLEAGLPPKLVRSALAISGLFDLEPLRHTPFLQPDLRLTPADVRRLSPARFPPPAAGRLHAVVGGAESAEFQRQNALIRAAWGEGVVPVCEAIPGAHHLGVLDGLADPGARLHRLARGLLDAA